MVNGALGEVVGFGLIHPLRKVVYMGPPRGWAPKLVGALGPCGQLYDHPFLPFRPQWQGLRRVGSSPTAWCNRGFGECRGVVVAYPPGNGGLQFVEVVVGAEVNQLAFKRPPQSLNEDVVHPPAATIHVYPAAPPFLKNVFCLW